MGQCLTKYTGAMFNSSKAPFQLEYFKRHKRLELHNMFVFKVDFFQTFIIAIPGKVFGTKYKNKAKLNLT